MSRTTLLWIVWLAATLTGGVAVAALVLVGGDRSSLLIGETTGVHAQFEMACESCHAGKPLDTDKKQQKALNKTCVTCHQDELKASNDSHPYKKFRDPRMADYWDRIDARTCTACHQEHRPEITRTGAVTLAMDYCVECHSEGEQDVRVNRPSHAGLG
ncbi:MAG: cytochrome c3 family protein, partial [Pseudomonadota bacterium]